MNEVERLQEAINWLKIDRDALEFPLSSPDVLNRDYIEIRARVLDTALSILRAQKQNEPVVAYDSGETDTELGDVFICSNCGGRIYVIYDAENNYCPKCGKPITFDEDCAHEPKGADQ